MVNFSVTQYGKPLDPKKYIWDEATRTFSSNENFLVIDGKGTLGTTFNTGNRCTFTTNNHCKFHTGNYCTFITGSHCDFNTKKGCSFITNENCSFDTEECCMFNYFREAKKLKTGDNSVAIIRGIGPTKITILNENEKNPSEKSKPVNKTFAEQFKEL